ncbi:neprilysin-1-like [Dermacentor silvarum]|uniref:neprilysin-1-like n=1 Tax=Dermacentor silvarum TaxID=543639 RepID=UPI00210182EC|nr:neprilysin-1-like [Dermacentor silvarum]
MNFKAVLITAWIWFPALATAYETASGTLQVCNSSECIQRAQLITESLNTSIDPCTDFYSYVCGRWESNHHLPSGRRSYDVYEEIWKDIPEMLSYILGNITLDENNQTIIDKVATMYNACLALPDTPDALIRVLNESGYNAWPILSAQNVFNSTNWTDLLRHMDISALFYVDVDKKGYARKPVFHHELYVKPMPILSELDKVPNINALINSTIKFLNPGITISVLENLTNELVQFSKNRKLEDRLKSSSNVGATHNRVFASFSQIELNSPPGVNGKLRLVVLSADQSAEPDDAWLQSRT